MLDEFRCFIEECVLAHALAINWCLNDVSPQPATSLITARYVAGDCAAELPGKVHSALGEKDAAKEWLAACLLKTIKDNQRWHETRELIDQFPESTSWFGKRHPSGTRGEAWRKKRNPPSA